MPAPLFDHGNALFNYAGQDALSSEEAFAEYANTLLPCVYDDFIGSAKTVLTPNNREGLRKLLDFKFAKHAKYNLPAKRLKLIEAQIRERARLLLE
jgi:hypothetical protein